MGRFLVIACVVLLIGSLVGIIVTYRSPVMVEQETSLLNYRHEGEFDYRIYLKPSSLFGPPPEQLSPNLRYPAVIVDTIDFTFNYSPAVTTPVEVKVNAVLEDPGIWQKVIELVPSVSIDGDFAADFSIDIDEMNEIFNVIQDETGITSSTHNLTIKAYVSTSVEDLVYSLPLKLSATLIEVDSNLRTALSYGTGEFDYVVHLKPNSIFDTTTLTPSLLPSTSSTTILKPGDVIFPNLVDTMDITYNYAFISDGPVNQMTTDVEITAVLEATDIWAKEFLLLHTEKTGGFDVSFPLNLTYYLDLLETIRGEIGVPAESYSLTITVRILATAETQFGMIDDIFIQSMTGTLEAGILEWEDDLERNEASSIKTSQMISNPSGFLGLSLSGARIAFPILAVVFFFLSFYSVVLYVRARPEGLSGIEQEVLRIKKKYGDRIVKATGQTLIEGERTISLGSIENLLNVADELGKLIVHQPPIKPKGPHAYYVFDAATRYQHLLGSRVTGEVLGVVKVV